MRERFVRCACNSPEHQVILCYDPGDTDFPEMYLEIHLTTTRSVLRRLWVALKYLFGYRCRYGEWDEVVLDSNKVMDVHDFVCEFLSCHSGVTIPEGDPVLDK